MKFSALFPSAGPFEEVKRLLFRQLMDYTCLWCRHPSPWLTYQFHDQPIAVCSDECLEQLVACSQAIESEP